MGDCLWIRLLLDFLFLGPQAIEAGEIGQLGQLRKGREWAVAFQWCPSISGRVECAYQALDDTWTHFRTMHSLNLYNGVESARTPDLLF